MRYNLLFGHEITGELLWEPDAYGVQVTLDSTIPCDPLVLLRCYAETGNGPFLIGLPEPRHGRLSLSRHISREALKEAGCLDAAPSLFYLSDGSSSAPKAENSSIDETEPDNQKVTPAPENAVQPDNSASKTMPVQTESTLLDELLENGELKGKAQEDYIELSCPFSPDKPFLLAHMFTLCNVENNVATAKLGIKSYTPHKP